MPCPVCGKEVSGDSKFCPHCGAGLNVAAGSGFTPVAGYGSSGEVPSPQQTAYAPVGGGAPPPYEPPPTGGYSAGTPPPVGYPPPPAGYPPPAGAGGLSDNLASAIAYLTIIPAIVFLVLEPYNRVPLIRFHAFQSIGLFVVAMILQAIFSLMGIGMHFMFGFFLFGMIHFVLSLGLFVVWLIAILKASKGEWYKLPVIGDFAEKQARG